MLWLFVILALILLWAIPAFRTLQEMEGQPTPRWRIPFLHLIDEPEEAAVVFVLLGIVFAVGGYAVMHGWGTLRDMVGDFYANIAMECFSVAVTVLIIERLYERRSKAEAEKAEKERLILQMGSPDNGFAVEAVRQLRQRGWLTDDSLVGADLREANLSGVDLSFAVLNNAQLFRANLSDSNMPNISLVGALLPLANLTNANLHMAILKQASFYGATLCSANLAGANLSHADLSVTDLRYAQYTKNSRFVAATVWPEGFDPKAAGAIEVEWNKELLKWIPVD